MSFEKIPLKRVQRPSGVPIVKAAVIVGEDVYTGWRHAHIMVHIHSQEGLASHSIGQDDQGFVDADGCFYNRYQSARIALKNGQTKRLHNLLTSEDLWDNEGVPHPQGSLI
jgi:hypothetical protein